MRIPPAPSVSALRRSRSAVAAGLLLLAWLWPGLVMAKPPAEVRAGEVMPDVAMRGLNGPDRRLGAYRGEPLLINVWASWCGPCRIEMGSLERLSWSDPPPRFRMIGISTDDSESAAKGFLRASNATLNHFLDRDLELESLLGANRLPLTVLLDAKGRVLARHVGAREWDRPEARKWIEDALKKPR